MPLAPSPPPSAPSLAMPPLLSRGRRGLRPRLRPAGAGRLPAAIVRALARETIVRYANTIARSMPTGRPVRYAREPYGEKRK